MTERTTRRSRKGEETRARVMDVARTLLVEQGYDAVVMRDIATRAGMALGNLQHYFPSRESLLEAVIRAEAETDLADLRAVRERGLVPAAELQAVVRLLVRKWRGDSGKVLALLGFLALHAPTFRTLYREVYERFYGELAKTLARLQPGRPSREYQRRARLLTALLDGASAQVNRGESAAFLDDVTAIARDLAGVGSRGPGQRTT